MLAGHQGIPWVCTCVPAHREAFTSLLVSAGTGSGRAIVPGSRSVTVPQPWRLCRFCRGSVEDEKHALLVCEGSPDLQSLRTSFLMKPVSSLKDFTCSYPANHLQSNWKAIALLFKPMYPSGLSWSDSFCKCSGCRFFQMLADSRTSIDSISLQAYFQ